MGLQVNVTRNRIAWEALSYAFIDNEIDYRKMAEAVSKYSRDEIRKMLYEDVAPICAPNLLAPAPEEWISFDSEWLVEGIEELRLRISESRIRRFWYMLDVLYYRRRFGYVWKKLESELDSL